MKRVSVYLTEEEHALVAAYAKAKQRSLSNLFLFCVRQEIKRHPLVVNTGWAPDEPAHAKGVRGEKIR
jgi:hypothetical protein